MLLSFLVGVITGLTGKWPSKHYKYCITSACTLDILSYCPLSYDHVSVIIIKFLREICGQLAVNVPYMFIFPLLTFSYHNYEADGHQYSYNCCGNYTS